MQHKIINIIKANKEKKQFTYFHGNTYKKQYRSLLFYCFIGPFLINLIVLFSGYIYDNYDIFFGLLSIEVVGVLLIYIVKRFFIIQPVKHSDNHKTSFMEARSNKE